MLFIASMEITDIMLRRTGENRLKGVIHTCYDNVTFFATRFVVSTWVSSKTEGGWFSRGQSPRENHPPEGRHSIRIPTLPWHICFIIPNKPQFGKISMKTTMTAGRSSENGGRFAGGHFAGGHDGMANLYKPSTAYDFQVRYNNRKWLWLWQTTLLRMTLVFRSTKINAPERLLSGTLSVLKFSSGMDSQLVSLNI